MGLTNSRGRMSMAEEVQTLLARLAQLEARLVRLEENMDRVMAEHQKDILALVMLISAKTQQRGERLDPWRKRGLGTLQQ